MRCYNTSKCKIYLVCNYIIPYNYVKCWHVAVLYADTYSFSDSNDNIIYTGVNSDKYMQMEAEGRKKKQKKKKRKKRKGGEEDSDDEDIPQQHQVSSVAEMPEVKLYVMKSTVMINLVAWSPQ